MMAAQFAFHALFVCMLQFKVVEIVCSSADSMKTLYYSDLVQPLSSAFNVIQVKCFPNPSFVTRCQIAAKPAQFIFLSSSFAA